MALTRSAGSLLARPGDALRRFLLGLITGLLYFGGTLYWIGSTIRTFGGLDWLAAYGVGVLLVAYLALYPALFALIVGFLHERVGMRALAAAPFVWIATEYARSHLLTGFPWVLLGYSQARVLPLAQLASVFGVYGLSVLVAMVASAFAFAVRTRRRPALVAVGATVAIVAVVAMWGAARMRDDRLVREGSTLRVALVQGNVPQDEKWDQARANEIFRRYLALTRQAAGRGARFIVWPESSTPFFFEEDLVGHAAIRRLATETDTYILVGSDQIERSTPPKYYNAAFLVTPAGQTAAVYRKMHLVPFGEYVPLKDLLFFAGHLVQAVSDFSPGDRIVMLPVDGLPATTAICYEAVYPEIARQAVAEGSRLLTTITNDAWYGYSSAPYQHFEQAALRAVEEGRYLARSANTGISAIIDPYGRIAVRSQLFQTEVLVGEVRFLDGRTVYARIGDVLPWISIAFTAALLVLARGRRGQVTARV